MFMLVNKRPDIFCANDGVMWVLEGKKVCFVNGVIKSYSRPIKMK